MPRLLPLLLVLAVACGDQDGTAIPKNTSSGAKATKPAAGAVTTTGAVTGSKVYQRDAEAIANDLKRLEDEGRPAEGEARQRFDREVRLRLQHIDYTLKALAVSIDAEKKQIVQQEAATLRHKEGGIRKEMDDLLREINTTQEMLEEHAKTGSLPPGFTLEELKDKLKDHEKQMGAKEAELQEVNGELAKKVALLQGESIPEQGDTVLTNERKVFERLKARAQKLVP